MSRSKHLAVITFALATLGSVLGQTPKFHTIQSGTLPHGCGDGLDQDSKICSCVSVGGVSVTKCASGDHICAKLPDRLTSKDVALQASAGINGAGFRPCGHAEGGSIKLLFGTVSAGGAAFPDSAPCDVGWSRFEAIEYYPDTHNICARFKNWSADRDITIRIDVQEQ